MVHKDPNDPRKKENTKRYYDNNKEACMKRSAERNESTKRFVDAIKSYPCEDCGQSYPPYVMQFDHRDPATKTGTIAAMIKRVSREKLLAEIMMCDVVCANCHAIRTHG